MKMSPPTRPPSPVRPPAPGDDEDDLWAGVIRPGEIPVATTHETEGEAISPEALRAMVAQIATAPIQLNVEHVPGVNPIGWIESARIVDLSDGEQGLVGEPRLLEELEFISPATLAPPAQFVPEDPTSARIRLAISYDGRDLDEQEVTSIIGATAEDIDVEARGDERRYSAEPIVAIALIVFVYPFVKRLGEHLADDTYAALKAGLVKLPGLVKRPKPDRGIYYLIDYPRRHGPIQLVIRVDTGTELADAWEFIDLGLGAGKAILETNPPLQRICLVWQNAESRWAVSFAITNDYRVVCQNPLIGEVAGDGSITTRHIVVSDEWHP